MAEGKKLTGAGLRGQSAGQTALCTVGKTGTGLTYRGYDISELAEGATFEEVAYLILYGELPNKKQLDAYKAKLKRLRVLPKSVKDVLERIPKTAHPMDVMRTGCSFLGNVEPEADFSQQQDVADRLLSTLPGIINYWYRFSHDGARIETETNEDSLAGHFLHLLHDKSPSELHQRVMDVSLILYAEHEFNASTFTARVCASTLSDMHSCVTGRDRVVARPTAWRRKRSGDGHDREVRLRQRRRCGHQGDVGAQGQDHGIRPRDLRHVRSAKRDHQVVGGEAGKIRRRQGSVPRLRRRRKDDVGRKEVVRERRLLPRGRLSFHGHPDEALHADLRVFARFGLDRSHHGTAFQQSHHPAQRGLYWSGAAPLRQTVRPIIGENERHECKRRPQRTTRPGQGAGRHCRLCDRVPDQEQRSLRHGAQLPDRYVGMWIPRAAFSRVQQASRPDRCWNDGAERSEGTRDAVRARSGESGVGYRLHDPLARLQRHVARRRVGASVRQPWRHSGGGGLHQPHERGCRQETARDARRAHRDDQGARDPGLPRAREQLQPRRTRPRVARSRRIHRSRNAAARWQPRSDHRCAVARVDRRFVAAHLSARAECWPAQVVGSRRCDQSRSSAGDARAQGRNWLSRAR